MQVEEPVRRNILLYGTVALGLEAQIVGGFYTYGDTTWLSMYLWTSEFLRPSTNLRFCDYDVATETVGQMHESSRSFVREGNYIIRGIDGSEIEVTTSRYATRKRVPTISNTPARTGHYRTRARARDNNTCLLTGIRLTQSRLKAAHIFPRSFDAEWIRLRFHTMITDPAPSNEIGGHLKIDSIQNIILIRSDLHDAWDNYEIGVDVTNNYKLVSFTNHNQDIQNQGYRLRLDHIADPNLRPLDALLREHFKQCIFKWMRGAAEEMEENEEDFDSDSIATGALDLSDTTRWSSPMGRHVLEHTLRDRLFDHQIVQEIA